MKHIVNFSGGLCSFWAAHRVVQKYGSKDVVLLFADTLEEDEDLHEFNRQASILLGVPITRVSREIGVWELFREARHDREFFVSDLLSLSQARSAGRMA